MLVLMVIISAGNAEAQIVNVLQSQITWTSTSNADVKTGDAFEKDVTFVTYSSDRIEVPNRNGAQVFTIGSVDGAWTDLNQQGKLVYHVTLYGQQGLITLERTGQGVFLTIDMTATSTVGIKRKFTIGQVAVNNK